MNSTVHTKGCFGDDLSCLYFQQGHALKTHKMKRKSALLSGFHDAVHRDGRESWCCCTCSICSIDFISSYWLPSCRLIQVSCSSCKLAFGLQQVGLVSISKSDSRSFTCLFGKPPRKRTSCSCEAYLNGHLKFVNTLPIQVLFVNSSLVCLGATPALPFWPKAFAGRSQPTTCENGAQISTNPTNKRILQKVKQSEVPRLWSI